jgi:hypothetical protein
VTEYPPPSPGVETLSTPDGRLLHWHRDHWAQMNEHPVVTSRGVDEAVFRCRECDYELAVDKRFRP